MLEKELKYALSAAAYRELLAYLKPDRISHQQNVYFDDPRFSLRRKRFSLRVRIVDGKKAKLTVKFAPPSVRRVREPAAFKIRHELESNLKVGLARQLIAGKKKIGGLTAHPITKIRTTFSSAIIAQLQPIGDLRTDRANVRFFGSERLEIDRCEVFDKVFYELEAETSAPSRTDRRIRALLHRLEIPYRPLRRSKQARLFSEIRARHRRSQRHRSKALSP